MSPTVSVVYKVNTQRQRKRKKHSDEATEPDQHVSGWDLFSSSTFILVFDRLVPELDRRFSSYDNVNHHFGFLNNILSLTPEELHVPATKLLNKYCSNLEMDLVDELQHFKALIHNESDTTARILIKIIKKMEIGVCISKHRHRSPLISHTASNKCTLWAVILTTGLGKKTGYIIKDFSARKTRKKFYKLELIHSMSTN